MHQIKQLYSLATKASSIGVEGYHVDKKYFDARRSRQDRILAASHQRSQTIKPALGSSKATFLDQLAKQQAKLPGPTTYDPKEYQRSSRQIKVESPPRMTYFEEMQKLQQKFNFPAPGNYDKVEVQPDKSKKVRSALAKAAVCSYLQNSMRGSIDLPGVGAYSARVPVFQPKGGPKWKQGKSRGKKSLSERGIKAAEVGTYDPVPVAYDLFQSIPQPKSKRAHPCFNREERFKGSKRQVLPFYNVASHWGMKDRMHKNDILSRLGSSLTHHSIYY